MRYKTLVPMLLMLSLNVSAEEQADAWEFGSEIEAGYRYDSNVGLTQIDENTSQSDQLVTLRGKLQANWQATDKLAFTASYQAEQERYREFSQYDLQIHTLTGEVSYQLPWFKVGISQHNADAKVAENDFLDFKQTSYYLGDLIGDSVYWRLAHQQITKTLTDYPQRNAKANYYSVDTFWFFAQGSRFLTFAYTKQDEVAAEPKFSFAGHQFRSSVNQTLQGWDHAQKLSLSITYQDHDYRAAWSPASTARQDQLTTLEGKWEVPLSNYFELALTAKHSNSESNAEVADYRDTTAGISFKLSF
ncbi:hypothetical protein ACQ5ES_10740 [Pseudidiomarina sp. E22-M8]|uniref:hypothetical protein n=1 Tax=Pseudidiomarina sp. E22-M8 TaxID=3424768 RepID=UPI00403C0A38